MAPRDGTLIDVYRDEIRFTDCHFERGVWAMKQGYPSVTTIFHPPPTHWMPRPTSLPLCDPYTGLYTGKVYNP